MLTLFLDKKQKEKGNVDPRSCLFDTCLEPSEACWM